MRVDFKIFSYAEVPPSAEETLLLAACRGQSSGCLQIKMLNSHFLFQSYACLSDTMLPAVMKMDSTSETVSQSKYMFSFTSVTMVKVSLLSNRNPINTEIAIKELGIHVIGLAMFLLGGLWALRS